MEVVQLQEHSTPLIVPLSRTILPTVRVGSILQVPWGTQCLVAQIFGGASTTVETSKVEVNRMGLAMDTYQRSHYPLHRACNSSMMKQSVSLWATQLVSIGTWDLTKGTLHRRRIREMMSHARQPNLLIKSIMIYWKITANKWSRWGMTKIALFKWTKMKSKCLILPVSSVKTMLLP